jgi:hypothetical protein
MTADTARTSIQAFAAGNRVFVSAETMLGLLPGASGSVKLMCGGSQIYVAKGTRNKLGLVAEHIVARLGQLLEAPVGEVALLTVPTALQSHPAIAAMGAGPAHAIPWIDDITDKGQIAQVDVPENRSRFARLCALYSLAGAGDHQLFYSTKSPQLVYSLDHGHFFPGGPNWTPATLAAAPLASIDPWFVGANLTNVELAEARSRLESITDTDVANIISGPPPEWTFTQDQRSALDTYIRTRRDRLLTLFPHA